MKRHSATLTELEQAANTAALKWSKAVCAAEAAYERFLAATEAALEARKAREGNK